MRKAIFALSLLIMAAFAFNACSSDDDDANEATNILGRWNMLSYGGGWSPIIKLQPGDVIVTFLADGYFKVECKPGVKPAFPFTEGKHTYQFTKLERSIFGDHCSNWMLIDGDDIELYAIDFYDGILSLSQEAYDGNGFSFVRTW